MTILLTDRFLSLHAARASTAGVLMGTLMIRARSAAQARLDTADLKVDVAH